MSQPRAAIVVTTIFEPTFLAGYLDDLERFGHRDSAAVIVIVDRKTPASVAAACAQARQSGFDVVCPTLQEQDAFVSRFPSLRRRVPYDTDNRRNIGFLMALERGVELLISIDDDNYCIAGSDFVGQHAVVGREFEIVETESSDRWFNIGTMLTSEPDGVQIFPRGFPYLARRNRREIVNLAPRRARVAMNAGLWVGDPDVDAISRLAIAPTVSAAAAEARYLAARTWSPINTQNTCVARDAIAAYYYVRMGLTVGGLKIDRYGDILSGYFCQAAVKSRGEAIRIGAPVADHRRTPHNLFKDLYHELAGMVIVEDLLPWLMELDLSGSTYVDLYSNLADELEARSHTYRGFIWDQGGDGFLRETAACMRAWLEAVRTIG